VKSDRSDCCSAHYGEVRRSLRIERIHKRADRLSPSRIDQLSEHLSDINDETKGRTEDDPDSEFPEANNRRELEMLRGHLRHHNPSKSHRKEESGERLDHLS
jgi:hypothetical protein